MITVMGATGNTGGQITERLLDAGERVRAVGRSASRLAALERAGAEPRVGEASDPAFLTEAFRGADAVYTLMPYDPRSSDYLGDQRRLGESIVESIRDAGVGHVVALSGVGAEQPSGTGFIVSLHAQEQRLRALTGTDILALRAGSFFEVFHEALGLIAEEGINADAVAPDVRIPMIATGDISEVAAEALRARDWEGFVVRELLGQRDLSYAEATRIIGERIGQPELEYVQLPDAEMAAVLTEAGFSAQVAGLHLEFTRALSEGRIRAREERGPRNTTATRFEAFADVLAAAYRAG